MVQYTIVKGKDLKVGDIIVRDGSRHVITSCESGSGASSYDFGEYINVYAQRLTKSQPPLWEPAFWTFRECPMIVERETETSPKEKPEPLRGGP